MSKHARHTFPIRLRFGDETVVFKPLGVECSEPMVEFARELPEQDLLFLERDITRPPEVEAWIRDVAAGNLVTIVAWRDDVIVGYATFDRGHARWTRHVAELRVMVAESARGLGVGRLLLELVFEMALAEGITKLVARMTPSQIEAQSLFQRLGFEEEALLRDHAIDAQGSSHDLRVLSFHTRCHEKLRCGACSVPVMTALSLDGVPLCSHCYELRYQELGGGG